MRTLKIKNQRLFLQDNIKEILEGQVKNIGSGAMVLIPKRYRGKKVYIIIKND